MKQPLTLKKNREFRRVYQQGKSAANRNLVLHYLKSSQPEMRIGITVSKKVGKSVVRNRVKRRIRESLRELQELLPDGYDLVWIARVSCQEADYQTLKSAVRHLLKKTFHSAGRKGRPDKLSGEKR
ncbi:MAG: ribonuclease P protein component [Bacillota bacterium]|nr:ribonuclease P protein component [Bacillota bacterium]MDW7677977.1 ribonuclease P protein component [Bacillota bacterium]